MNAFVRFRENLPFLTSQLFIYLLRQFF